MGKSKKRKRPNNSPRSGKDARADSHHLGCGLSFQVQHSLLVYLQNSLENVCHEFGTRWCPGEMVRQGWTYPASLELTSWIHLLRRKDRVFPAEALGSIEAATFNRVMREVSQIRHCAVHRKPQSNRFILRSLDASMMFAKLHRAEQTLISFEVLSQSCHELISELERHQATLEQKLQATMQNIAVDLQRPQLITRTYNNDTGNTFLTDKVYLPQSGLQLHRLKKIVRFVCERCKGDSESVWVAFPVADAHQPLCNKCYAHVLAGEAAR